MSPRCNISMENGERCTPFPLLFCLISLSLTGPKHDWTHHSGGPHMRPGWLPSGDAELFYFSDDHPPCLAGSKGWSRSSGSVAYGQPRASMCSVQNSNAPLDVLISAVSGSFFHSQTSWIKNHNFKNTLSYAAISVAFTQSIIVSWTLLNNTGVQRNFVSIPWCMWQLLRRWKPKLRPL